MFNANGSVRFLRMNGNKFCDCSTSLICSGETGALRFVSCLKLFLYQGKDGTQNVKMIWKIGLKFSIIFSVRCYNVIKKPLNGRLCCFFLCNLNLYKIWEGKMLSNFFWIYIILKNIHSVDCKWQWHFEMVNEKA